jgi:hypothetical protein
MANCLIYGIQGVQEVWQTSRFENDNVLSFLKKTPYANY